MRNFSQISPRFIETFFFFTPKLSRLLNNPGPLLRFQVSNLMEYFYSLWKSALPISNTPSLAERLDDVIITSSSMGGVTSRFLSGWRMRTQDDGPAGKVHGRERNPSTLQRFFVKNRIS